MKLLLDEMFPGDVAQGLRDRGHDVVAAADEESLRGTPDADLLALAVEAHRALVTENVDDYVGLDAAWRQARREHWGIVLTSSRRFPRSGRGIGRLVRALDGLLRAHPEPSTLRDRVLWLE